MRTTITLVLFVIAGCRTAPNKDAIYEVPENHKDVLVLTTLIRDHFLKTDELTLNLDELLQSDSLDRITNNFVKVELKMRGGHIAVYYKFSKSRETKEIELTEKETRRKIKLKSLVKDVNDQYDGEIQYYYNERFYRIKKITIKEKDNTAKKK